MVKPKKRRIPLATGVIVGATVVASIGMAAPAVAATPRPADCTLKRTPTTLNEGPTDYSLFLRPTGEIDVVVLFVDFPDQTSTDNTNEIAGLLSGIDNDYASASYGKLDIQVDFVHEWYRMPSDATSYDYQQFDDQRRLFVDATTAADDDVNFSGYEIILTVEGDGGIHPYSPAWIGTDFPVQTDEGPIRYGSALGQDIYDPTRGFIVPVHEMGHIFGLPDLYAFEGELHRFVSSWDVMGNIDAKPGMSAWHRNKMGWLTDNQVVCMGYSGTRQVTLKPVGDMPVGPADGRKLVIVKTSNSKAYAIEYRTDEGLDSNLCDEGILVYRVDANVATGEGPIELLPAHPPPGGFSCPSDVNGYEPLQTPAFDLEAGGETTFFNANDELTVEVLSIDDSEEAVISVDYQGGSPQPLNYKREIVIKNVTEKGVIKGRVKAEGGAPGGCEANAPVRVRSKKNNKVLAKGRTDGDGSFELALGPGEKRGRKFVGAPEKKVGLHFCLSARSNNFRV